MQWYGRKRFFVFAPADTENIYPKEGEDISQIEDVEHVDIRRFPKFANANMIQFTLNPGETLFNPSGWWHTTRTLDVSIATVISFANASNWNYLIRHMLPQGWKSKLAFMPFAAYLAALGLFRLPFWHAPNAADPLTAAAARKLFERRVGAQMQHLPESKYSSN